MTLRDIDQIDTDWDTYGKGYQDGLRAAKSRVQKAYDRGAADAATSSLTTSLALLILGGAVGFIWREVAGLVFS